MKKRKPSKAELKKINSLPFIETVSKTKQKKSLNIKFKPVVVSIKQFRSITHGKNHGKRYFYLGSYTLTISLEGSKTIRLSTSPIQHPHSNQSGYMCFGGHAKKEVNKLFVKNEYAELSKMVWYWLHIFTNNGYLIPYMVYNDVISRGFPIWDARGKRIMINEKKRLKRREQTPLPKFYNYDSNVKKFKDLKIEDFK